MPLISPNCPPSSAHWPRQFVLLSSTNSVCPLSSVVLLFVLLLSIVVQLHPSSSFVAAAAVLPSQGPNEAGSPILLSRYGRAAAVLSRYGKRGGGTTVEREFEGGVGAGPWFLCKLSLDEQILRCRSPFQRRKK